MVGLSPYQNNAYPINSPPVKDRDFDAYVYAKKGIAGFPKPANSGKYAKKDWRQVY